MNFNKIPEELKLLPIWCVWNLEKGGKIPYNPRTGYKANQITLKVSPRLKQPARRCMTVDTMVSVLVSFTVSAQLISTIV